MPQPRGACEAFHQAPGTLGFIQLPALAMQAHRLTAAATTAATHAAHAAPARALAIAATPLPAAAALQPPVSYLESSAGGYVVALAVLLSVRQGRVQADDDRTDVRALEVKQQDSRVQVG